MPNQNRCAWRVSAWSFLRGMMFFVVGASSIVTAQPVQVQGYLEVDYDDVLTELFVQGRNVIGDTVQVHQSWGVAVPFNATVTNDTLVIAATVRNGGYTGGLMINAKTSMGQAVTNGSWKWMLRPAAGWEQPDYNDAGWYAVKDQGGAAETPGWVRDPSCVNQTDTCPGKPFAASGARFLWAAEDLYFRRTFTVDSACSATVWAGCRGPHVVYFDGQEVTRDDSIEHSTPGKIFLSQGTHVLAVFARTTRALGDGTGGVLKVAVAKSIKVPVPIIEWDSLFNPDTVGWDTTVQLRPVLVSDTNWRVSPTEFSDWMAPSFDDASWWKAAIVNDQLYPRGYPGLTEFPAGYRAMWLPQIVSFRGKIALSQLPVIPGIRASGAARALEIGYAAGRITVRSTVGSAFTVEVFGSQGRRVYCNRGVRSDGCSIRCEGWARGSYVVRVGDGRSVVTRTVTVTR